MFLQFFIAANILIVTVIACDLWRRRWLAKREKQLELRRRTVPMLGFHREAGSLPRYLSRYLPRPDEIEEKSPDDSFAGWLAGPFARMLQAAAYMTVSEPESNYDKRSPSLRYQIPASNALRVITTSLQTTPIYLEGTELRWQLDGLDEGRGGDGNPAGSSVLAVKATGAGPNDVCATVVFDENVEPLLRGKYMKAYGEAPMCHGYADYQERTINLDMYVKPIGVGTCRVSLDWQIGSPKDHTSCGDAIALTTAMLDSALLAEETQYRMKQLDAMTKLHQLAAGGSNGGDVRVDTSSMPAVAREAWPSPQEYNEAIQIGAYNLHEGEASKGSHPELNALGLPRPSTGAFASVYKIIGDSGRAHAVRCFLRPVTDQSVRYSAVSRVLQASHLDCTVPFQFIEDGISVNGKVYPIVSMDWVDGSCLATSIEQELQNARRMRHLADEFAKLSEALATAGIAHGDLQHANIMITDRGLRLVDYDGMFVPELSGMLSNELGHPNYQHPQRRPQDFNAQLDHFSAWIIYLSLMLTAEDWELWQKFDGGDECLLFRHSDYVNPSQSPILQELAGHKSALARQCGELVHKLLRTPLAQVPPLDASLLVDAVSVQ